MGFTSLSSFAIPAACETDPDQSSCSGREQHRVLGWAVAQEALGHSYTMGVNKSCSSVASLSTQAYTCSL